jgi:hypothetical protein
MAASPQPISNPRQPSNLLRLPGTEAPLGQESPRRRVQRVSWEAHTRYLSEAWTPDEGGHISVIAPTGRGGKTYMVTRGLLPFFEDHRVIFIDVKDRDKTVWPPGGKPFFKHRVREFPNKAQVSWASWPKHFHLHVRSGLAGTSLAEQARIVYDALSRAYKQKDWIIVADEMKFLADYEGGLRLYAPLRDIWTRGRSNVTLIAMTQYPSRVPTEMFGQATHLYLGRLNVEGNKRLGEIGGTVDYKVVRNALADVHKREFLYLNKAADEPEQEMVITGL